MAASMSPAHTERVKVGMQFLGTLSERLLDLLGGKVIAVPRRVRALGQMIELASGPGEPYR